MRIEDYCINENAPLAEALIKLNQYGARPVYILRDGRLIAVIADSDVRRFILKTGRTNVLVSEVANYKPHYLLRGEEDKATQLLNQFGYGSIPVVDDDMHIVNLLFLNAPPKNSAKKINVPVVINAGGLGARLSPYTKILPKPLIPVGELPVSEIIINRFYEIGCDKFYMIVNYKKNMVKAYYNEIEKDGYELTFIDEEQTLGTGGGLKLLEKELDSTFVFINCDTVIDENFQDILELHKKHGNAVTMVTALKRFDVPYGVVETGANGEILGFLEKPKLSYLVNTGCYIVEPQVIRSIKSGENIGFPSVIERIRGMGMAVGIYPIQQDAWLDMGEFDTLEDMKKRLILKNK